MLAVVLSNLLLDDVVKCYPIAFHSDFKQPQQEGGFIREALTQDTSPKPWNSSVIFGIAVAICQQRRLFYEIYIL
jgi:hypothetical protein